MAVMTLSIPDELLATYTTHNPQNPARGIVKQLERFAEYAPSDRPLIVSTEVMNALEKMAGRTLESDAALQKWIERVHTVGLEGFDVKLSGTQRARLKQEADFFKQPVEAYSLTRITRAITAALGI